MEGARNEPQRAVAETLRGTQGCVSAEKEERQTAARGVWQRTDSAKFLWGGEKRNQVSVPRVPMSPSIPENKACQQLAGRSGPDGLNPVKQQKPFFRQNLSQSNPTPPPGPASPHRQRTIHPFQQPHLQMEQRRLREGRSLAGADGSPPLNALPSALSLSLTSQLFLWAFGGRGFIDSVGSVNRS